MAQYIIKNAPAVFGRVDYGIGCRLDGAASVRAFFRQSRNTLTSSPKSTVWTKIDGCRRHAVMYEYTVCLLTPYSRASAATLTPCSNFTRSSANRSPDNTDFLPTFLYFPSFLAMAIPSRCRSRINDRSNCATAAIMCS